MANYWLNPDCWLSPDWWLSQDFWLNSDSWLSPDQSLAAFTGLLVLVGLLQLGVFGLQARRLRQTIDTMRGAERRQLRAYVGIHQVVLEAPNLSIPQYTPITKVVVGTGSPDRLVITVKNFGQTPANRVHTWANWTPTPYAARLPADFQWLDLDTQTSGDVRPAWTRPSIFPEQTFPQPVSINDLTVFRNAVAKKAWVYVYGHIDYVDIYGQQCSTTFCFVYDPTKPGGEQFIPYEEHNEAK